MVPGSIISAHNVMSTVPVAERYLSACFAQPQGVRAQDVVFRVLVNGQVVYNNTGSPAVPTCVQIAYPTTMETGTEVRVQALVNGSIIAEDLYRHEEVSDVKKAIKNVELATSQIDPQTVFFIVVVCAALVWYFFFREDAEASGQRKLQYQMPVMPVDPKRAKVQR